MSTNVCVTTEDVTLTLPASMCLAASGVSVTRALKVTATGAMVCHKDSVICHKDSVRFCCHFQFIVSFVYCVCYLVFSIY